MEWIAAEIAKANQAGGAGAANENEHTKEFFNSALKLLDTKIAKLEDFKPHLPLHLIAAGGYVSVAHLQNRDTTEDLDYFMDPSLDARLPAALTAAIQEVSKEVQVDEKWMNRAVTVWLEHDAKQVYDDSLTQNVVLWQGENLVLYAVKWEWSLRQKLERYVFDRRAKDLSDSVCLVKKLVDAQGGAPLTSKKIISWSSCVHDPISAKVVKIVADDYKAKYGKDGIIMSSRH